MGAARPSPIRTDLPRKAATLTLDVAARFKRKARDAGSWPPGPAQRVWEWCPLCLFRQFDRQQAARPRLERHSHAAGRSFGDEPVKSVEEVFESLIELGRGVIFGEPGLESANVREVVEIEILVGAGDVGLALVEGFLGRSGLGAEQGSFQQ